MALSPAKRLDAKQREIVREIQKLHRHRQPLNLTWIKRNRADLLRAAYSMKPFWGWKRGLDAAGLDHKVIRVELDDRSKCRICGAYYVHLANHVVLAHGMEPDEYRQDYPDSDLNSETLRAAKCKMRSSILPHWEPLWTREYVLDRTHELHRRRLPVHSAWVQHNDSALSHAALRYFGNWATVLRRIGVDPREATRAAYLSLRAYPDKPSICREIRRRHRAGLSVSAGGLRNGAMRTAKNLSRFHGAERSRILKSRQNIDSKLLDCAIEYFGSWDRAITAAGLDPSRVRLGARHPVRYPTAKAILAEVRRRHRLHLPLKVTQILKGAKRDSALIVGARVFFGSWHNCMNRAGVPIPEPARRRRARSRSKNPRVSRST